MEEPRIQVLWSSKFRTSPFVNVSLLTTSIQRSDLVPTPTVVFQQYYCSAVRHFSRPYKTSTESWLRSNTSENVGLEKSTINENAIEDNARVMHRRLPLYSHEFANS